MFTFRCLLKIGIKSTDNQKLNFEATLNVQYVYK